MVRRAWTTTVAVVLAALSVVPPAGASPSDLLSGKALSIASVPGSGAWTGDVVIRLAGDPTNGWALVGEGVNATVFQTTRSSAQHEHHTVGLGTRTNHTDLVGARLRGVRFAPDAVLVLVLHPDTDQELRWSDSLVGLSATDTPSAIFPGDVASEESGPRHHRYVGVDAGRLTGVTNGTFSYTGRFELFAWDVDLASGPLLVQTGRSTMDPTPAHMMKHDDRFAHVVGHARRLSVASGLLAQVWTGPMHVRGLSGELVLQGFTGNATHSGEALSVPSKEVRVTLREGDVTFSPHDDRSVDVSASGAHDSLMVAGVPIEARPAFPAAVIATGLAATLATIAYVAWRTLGASVVALFSRRTRTEGWSGYVTRTFENPRRLQMLHTILSRPGIQPFHVWQAVGGAFGATLRGLERLERVGAVRSVKRGRFRHYFGTPTNASADVAQETARATRTGTQTCEFLARNPGSSLRQVSAGLGIAAATAHWRLRRLAEAGVVESRRERGRVVYALRARPTAFVGPVLPLAPGVPS